jgi:hypothetical protein
MTESHIAFVNVTVDIDIILQLGNIMPHTSSFKQQENKVNTEEEIT